MLQNLLPLCSRFVSSSPGNLKDFENSPSPFIVQSNVIYESTSSMVFISSCCFSKNKNLNMLRLKKKETDLDRKGEGNSDIFFEHQISDSKRTIFD